MKIIEAGVVKTVTEGRATVILSGDQSALCRTCRACSQVSPGLREVQASAPQGVRAGDRVQVEVNIPSRYTSMFMLLILPLLGLLVGAVVGQALGRGNDLMPTVLAVLFMAAFFAGGFLYDRFAARRGAGEATIVDLRRAGRE